MHFPRSQKKLVLMLLGTLGTISLILLTWVMALTCAWLSTHYLRLNVAIDRTGVTKGLDFAREFERSGFGSFLIAIETIGGTAFLSLLWHTLYQNEKRENSTKKLS